MKKVDFKNVCDKAKQGFLSFMYPSDASCYVCDEDLSSVDKTHLCYHCKSKLPFIKNPCKKCGKDVDKGSSCRDCISKKYYFNKAISVCNFDDFARECVYRFKSASQRCLGEFMAFFMYCAFVNAKIDVDSIICVPISKRKLKMRGFNQAEDLLKHINKFLGLEDLSECVYERDCKEEQKKLGANDRLANVKKKFRVRKLSKIENKNILLIDDVMTTGATANRISQVLRYGGASKVYVLTFASVKAESIKGEKVESVNDMIEI